MKFPVGLVTFRRAQDRLREAFTCKECGKSNVAMNAAASMRFLAERVTPATHCTCPEVEARRTIVNDIIESDEAAANIGRPPRES